MSERIDHAQAAVAMLMDAQEAQDLTLISAIVNGAQVHATLALVEQQKIANIIALASPGMGQDTAIDAVVERPAELERDTYSLRPDIAMALGLTAGQEREG